MSDKKNSIIQVEVTPEQQSISENFGYTHQEIAVIQNTVAKGTNKVELAYFINVCKTVGLNPFVKEIWCYKDNKGNLLVFAGRDGYLAKAQQSPQYNGIRSIEIRENDKYTIDVLNNKVIHEITKPQEDRGEILYGVAIVFRKNGEPTIEIADFNIYNKGYNTWRTHPGEMIKKVAETHALKKAFGISGIQSEYDFEKKGDYIQPINTERKEKTDEEKADEIKLLLEVEGLTIPEDERMNVERILDQKETTSYDKAIKILNYHLPKVKK